jgi:linoleoyl-CoA desaturase
MLMATVVLIVALTATATCVFHDANHASFSTSRLVNRLAGFTGDLLGASSWIWKFKHNNLHHGNTNMVGFDADIDQAPFARLAPDQPMKHAMALGYVGTVLGLVGLAVTWGKGLGPNWYPIALVVLAVPQCWAGGKLYEMLSIKK